MRWGGGGREVAGSKLWIWSPPLRWSTLGAQTKDLVSPLRWSTLEAHLLIFLIFYSQKWLCREVLVSSAALVHVGG